MFQNMETLSKRQMPNNIRRMKRPPLRHIYPATHDIPPNLPYRLLPQHAFPTRPKIILPQTPSPTAVPSIACWLGSRHSGNPWVDLDFSASHARDSSDIRN